jgi:hypothetical protein
MRVVDKVHGIGGHPSIGSIAFEGVRWIEVNRSTVAGCN